MWISRFATSQKYDDNKCQTETILDPGFPLPHSCSIAPAPKLNVISHLEIFTRNPQKKCFLNPLFLSRCDFLPHYEVHLHQVLDRWTTSVSVLGFWGLWTWIVEFHLRGSSWGSPSKQCTFFCTVMFKGVKAKVLSSFEWFKWLGMMCLIVNMVFEKLHFSRQIHSKPGLCLKTCLRYLLDSGWAWGLFSV